MGKTVDDGFREFHGTLTPTREQSQSAKRHRVSIEICLKNSFEMTRFVHTGSFGNGTSIRGYSDVDYFACIPTKNLYEDSLTTLQEVREVLLGRFQDADITIKQPAVRVSFGADAFDSIEIVPADFLQGDHGGNFIYEIADGAGGWLRSSPDAHHTYVDEVNRKLGGKVKPLVSVLKAWKYFHGVPIRSFYLEMYVAQYASKIKSILFSKDVSNILTLLWENQLAALPDPKGIIGNISPCATKEQKSHALDKLDFSSTRAEEARAAETAGKISDAFYWWNVVFARKFPSYD